MAAYDILKDADEIVTHNGKSFNVKVLNTRLAYYGMPPLPKMHHVDTKHAAKGLSLYSNSLANVAKFFEFESCGKCTPCREGTMRVLAILENISVGDATLKDLDTLQELAEVIKETSFCGLGKTATTHILYR